MAKESIPIEEANRVLAEERAFFAQVAAERDRYKAALVALSRHSDSLRATNWPGLASIIDGALSGGEVTDG